MLMAGALAIGVAASAQQPLAERISPEVAARMGLQQDTTTISVNFPGGTLEEYVRALREATKDPVNVSLQGDAARLRIEPLVLREVSIESALRAALGSRPGQNLLENDGSMTSTRLETIQATAAGKPVFVITTQRVPGGGPGSADASIDVLTIRSLVQSDDAKHQDAREQVVLAAIDSGLKLLGSTEGVKPQIDYHQDSGLLLVRGQARDVALVREIVGRMTEDQKRQNAEMHDRRKNEINNRAAMQRAELSMRVADTRVGEAQRRLDETQKLVDAGSASTRDLSDARMASIQAETEVGMARIEIMRLKDEAAAGVESPSGATGDEVAQLRADLAKALARIKELEDQAAPKKGGVIPAPKGK
jgi:hypothetical protein